MKFSAIFVSEYFFKKSVLQSNFQAENNCTFSSAIKAKIMSRLWKIFWHKKCVSTNKTSNYQKSDQSAMRFCTGAYFKLKYANFHCPAERSISHIQCTQ